MTRPSPAVVVVLAAGEGTRMRSATPKVLHPLAGRSLLSHVLAATRDLDAATTAVVVGAGRDQVTATLPADVVPVVQAERRGTGHAVRTALAALDPRKPDDLVVVLPGDAPLLRAATLTALVDRHVRTGAVATLLTAVVDDPFGYGRIVREPDGHSATPDDAPVRAIVEERDADEATRAIHEVCTSVYVFAAGALEDALSRLTTDNSQGEEYLTDVIGLFSADREPVAAHRAADPAEVVGVNDRVQLAAAGRLLNDRLVRAAMLGGATVVDPATTWLDAGVTVGSDVTLLPGTRLCGATTVGDGARIGPDTTLTDTAVGAGAVVRTSTCDTAEIGAGAQVGPYAHLRPGSRLGPGAKVGAFAETKNADLGEGTKVPHLAYVGDATVGRFSNVGCGTIFVNYDGVTKNRTVVGDHVKLGSASLLIAPVHVGDGAYTGGGALVRQDVPPGALAIREGRQRTIDGWVARRRPGTPAADAAARANADHGTPDHEAPPAGSTEESQ